jgi:hypothetical protein
MSQFKFNPLDLGLPAACGSEMLLKSEALRADRPIYCPCGALQFVPEEMIDAFQARIMRLAVETARGG